VHSLSIGWLGLLALTAQTPTRPPATSGSESCLVTVPGALLEWKRRPGKPGEFKVKKVEQGSRAAALGYLPGDEILSIGGGAFADDDLAQVLRRSVESGPFAVRRKREQLELPPLFQAARVLESRPHGLDPGAKAPRLSLFGRDGKRLDALEVLRGRVVLLAFWAVWCKPCLDEMPIFRRLREKYGDRVAVLAVNLDDDRRVAEDYVKENPPGVPVVAVGGMRSIQAISYHVEAIPLTVLVDRDGSIAQVLVGYDGVGQEKRLSTSLDILLDDTVRPVLVLRK
jgi:thiol-disulfide isomerase/thioredoxin